jgi:hypothetical protein
MGNTSSIAELKSKADVHRKTRDALKSRREEHMKEAKEAAVEAAAVSGEDEEMDVLAPLPASEPRVGLSLMRGMSSKRFKREDEETSQWKVTACIACSPLFSTACSQATFFGQSFLPALQ